MTNNEILVEKDAKKIIWKKTIHQEEIIEITIISGDEKSNEVSSKEYVKYVLPILRVESHEASTIDDTAIRKELANMIGLIELPSINPESIDDLTGLFDDILEDEEEYDGVKLLKTYRKIHDMK